MPLRLYDTLTASKVPFTPAQPGHARVYYCGPTVYDYAHLGHIRSAVVYDVLVRHLRATGTRVTFVRNVTDIDDKIIKRAGELGEPPSDLARRFERAYGEDMAAVGNVVPDVEPRVSDHLVEIRALIETLVAKGAAYESQGDVYFSVAAFPSYGKLSHRKLDELEHGASGRTSDEELAKKKHPADFALWKAAKPGEPAWESSWGPGRPGWHIECSAMSMKHLGETLDLHGGGLDLVFPHHENEIAQSEAATGKPFSRTWVHNGFVEVDKTKMSKSLGNFFTARDIFARVDPEAVRWFVLTAHYRAPLNFDWTVDDGGKVTGFPQLEEAERRIEYLYSTKERLAAIPESRLEDAALQPPAELVDVRGGLAAALDEDMNFPAALAKVNELARAANELAEKAKGKKAKVPRAWVELARAGFDAIGVTLGLGLKDPRAVLTGIRDRRAAARGITGSDVEAKIAARTAARAGKDFAKADAIRDELAALGVELLDSPDGTTWRMG